MLPRSGIPSPNKTPARAIGGWQPSLEAVFRFLATESDSPARLERKLSLGGLFLLTTAVALTLGLTRILGPDLSFSFFLAAYAFAPTLTLLAMWCLVGYSRKARITVATGMLLGFVSIMTLLCGYSYGLAAIPWVLIATAIEWPGQLAIVLCLRWIALADGTNVASDAKTQEEASF